MSVFGVLEELRSRPIPDQTAIRARPSGWRAKVAIDHGSVRFQEPLVDVKAHGIAGENYYYATRNPPYWRRIDGSVPDLLARSSVAERLAAVNARIKPFDLELYVFDAWRPRAVQAYFHDVWMPAELQKRNPTLSGDALWHEVGRYWSPPTTDPSAPAPHSTGGAVDLTLRWIGGDQLWMGSLFDDATAIAHRDHFEIATAPLGFSDEEARANRRLLHWLMSDAGFTGYYEEWWHFSYGDQYWAELSGAPAALYGLARD
ncbi:MAG TPA: M15 family metallopeptidase [Rhizomicrobium sp.]